mmetsp:Transcript_25732/g.67356  ORF Transcript_25732/g.67356 Transcript_25732/m.67356 type:complete len:190 (-) Transcript_25732:47-616(-)
MCTVRVLEVPERFETATEVALEFTEARGNLPKHTSVTDEYRVYRCLHVLLVVWGALTEVPDILHVVSDHRLDGAHGAEAQWQVPQAHNNLRDADVQLPHQHAQSLGGIELVKLQEVIEGVLAKLSNVMLCDVLQDPVAFSRAAAPPPLHAKQPWPAAHPVTVQMYPCLTNDCFEGERAHVWNKRISEAS